MDLARAVNELRSELSEFRAEFQERFDHLEGDLVHIKSRLFDVESVTKRYAR